MNNIIENNIKYVFKNKKHLTNALEHSSIKRATSEFERLEFLGDRVLGLAISEFLYKNHMNANEGGMAKRLASLVCADACYKVANNICINEHIKTANNKTLQNNRTVMADAMEALLGAIYLDSGEFERVKSIIINLWGDLLLEDNSLEPKTQLQEITQGVDGNTPVYTIISKVGPDHSPVFTVEVAVNEIKAVGVGSSKKIAETNAAIEMLKLVNTIKK